MQVKRYSDVDIQHDSVRIKTNNREWNFTGWKARLISGTVNLMLWSLAAAFAFVIYRGIASFF